MTQAGQLTLEFEHRPALGGEDFLVAPPNAEAVRWLDAWPDGTRQSRLVLIGKRLSAGWVEALLETIEDEVAQISGQ